MAPTDSSHTIWDWIRRPTLSRRLALAILVSLVAIQAQAFLQVRYLSNIELRLVGTRWLAQVVSAVYRTVDAATPQERKTRIDALARSTSLNLTLTATVPSEPDEKDEVVAAQLAATVQSILGLESKALRINASSLRFQFPTDRIRLVSASAQQSRLPANGAIGSTDPDVLIPAGMRVSLLFADGSWLTAELIALTDDAIGSSLPYAPLLVGAVIVAVISTLTARHMLAPLDRLVEAARRIGTAREPVRVETVGLFEFTVVAQAFEDMQKRLLRFVDDRTRMLAAISHDLRSSLTRLRIVAEHCPESERNELAAEIEDMSAMVDATLAFAAGEAQLAQARPTDVAALVISLVDDAVDLGRSCTYAGPDHIEIMAHPASLKRALWNIMDNAFKYGGDARVKLDLSPNSVRIEVEDEGPGIPVEFQDEMFAPFRRLDPARSHVIPGAGLGLTIARDVIQSHGGDIALVSRDGHGLTVRVDLPVQGPRVGASVST